MSSLILLMVRLRVEILLRRLMMMMKKTVDIPAKAAMMIISIYFLSSLARVSLLSTRSSVTSFVMSFSSSGMQEQVDKSNVKPAIYSLV